MVLGKVDLLDTSKKALDYNILRIPHNVIRMPHDVIRMPYQTVGVLKANIKMLHLCQKFLVS